jgi:hypothetical protein
MSKLSAKIGNIIKNPTPASPHQAGVVLPFAGILAPNGWAMCQGQEISKTIYTDLFSALSFSQTVTTSNTSTTVTTSSTGNLNVGTGVSGTGIPSGAYVASITNSTTFVLSSAATASGSVTAVFALYDRQIDPTTGSAWAAPTSGFFRVPDLRGVFLRGAGTPSGLSTVTVGGFQSDAMKNHNHGMSADPSSFFARGPGVATGSSGGVDFYISSRHSHDSLTQTESGTATDTRPRNRGVNYIIKLWNDTTYGIAVGVADHQKGVTSGLVPVNGLSAANITLIDSTDSYNGNTKLGLMQYVAGTNYNGGISPTVTGTNWSTVRAIFVPYQMADSTWRAKFNVQGNFSVATAGTSLSVTGLTVKSATNQAIAVFHSDGVDTWVKGQANGSANTLSVYAGATRTSYCFSGDIELNSKPTWAY